jgi:hypothetical protein
VKKWYAKGYRTLKDLERSDELNHQQRVCMLYVLIFIPSYLLLYLYSFTNSHADRTEVHRRAAAADSARGSRGH